MLEETVAMLLSAVDQYTFLSLALSGVTEATSVSVCPLDNSTAVLFKEIPLTGVAWTVTFIVFWIPYCVSLIVIVPLPVSDAIKLNVTVPSSVTSPFEYPCTAPVALESKR